MIISETNKTMKRVSASSRCTIRFKGGGFARWGEESDVNCVKGYVEFGDVAPKKLSDDESKLKKSGVAAPFHLTALLPNDVSVLTSNPRYG